MIRDIAGGQLFDNGNKQTAVEVFEQLIIKNGVDGPLKRIIWNVVDKVATGHIRSRYKVILTAVPIDTWLLSKNHLHLYGRHCSEGHRAPLQHQRSVW